MKHPPEGGTKPASEFMADLVMPFGPLLISVYTCLFVEQIFCDGCVERISTLGSSSSSSQTVRFHQASMDTWERRL